MAYIDKVYSTEDTNQGNAVVATSMKNFKTLETVYPDGVTFSEVSGDLERHPDSTKYSWVRYYAGDTIN